MPTITTQQITALAPDTASIKAARALIKPNKWPILGNNDQGMWGECQGSGTKPYQVLVDRQTLATKCSCPSRKFPCKHALALLLMVSEQTANFSVEPPSWFQEWYAKRIQKSTHPASKATSNHSTEKSKGVTESTTKSAKTSKTNKTIKTRLTQMRSGAQELDLWMRDLIREGIADLPSRAATLWRDIAARMVDAKAPGLARRIEDLATVLYALPEWPQHILAGFGRIKLLIEALNQYEHLSESLQADVRVALGWALNKEAALAGEQIEDNWLVLGIVFEENGPLVERRVWIYGLNSHRTALIQEFAHGGRNFATNYLLGNCLQGTASFFPSATPQRIIFSDIAYVGSDSSLLDNSLLDSSLLDNSLSDSSSDNKFPINITYTQQLEQISKAMAINPFIWRMPIGISNLRLAHNETTWNFVDTQNLLIRYQLSEQHIWHILAITGGIIPYMFGEWKTGIWYPISVKSSTNEWLDLTI